MKNFILSLFFFILAVSAYGQFADVCPGGPEPLTLTNDGDFAAEVCNLTAAFNDETDYAATSLTPPFKTGFYSFTVTQPDYYRISFLASGANPASGILSVGFGTNPCPVLPAQLTETDAGNIVNGFDITSSCVLLTVGTTYYIATALENANVGEFTITITKGGIDVCAAAESVVEDPVGGPNLNVLNNLCSTGAQSDGPGTIWSVYTVGPETPNEHINVDISTTAISFPTGSPSVISVWLNGCPGVGEDITGNVTCLSAGDVLYIESGNTTPNTGTYNLNIDQYYDGEPNDDCADLTGAITTLTCVTPITGNGNTDACPDAENTCNPATDVGVWFRFSVASQVPAFSFTGNNFQVFTGASCAALTSLGCDGDASLTAIEDNPATTYWVLVFENGTFTATSDVDVPDNDLCADAVTLTNGIEGYNSCATMTNPAYCSLNTGTAHDVYYTYTNNGTNSVNLEVTVDASTATTGFAATEVSVQVYSNCTGTVFPGFTQQCNTLWEISLRLSVSSRDNRYGLQ